MAAYAYAYAHDCICSVDTTFDVTGKAELLINGVVVVSARKRDVDWNRLLVGRHIAMEALREEHSLSSTLAKIKAL